MLKTADETSNNGLYIILNKNLINSIGIDVGLIEIKVLGLPAKRHFKIISNCVCW